MDCLLCTKIGNYTWSQKGQPSEVGASQNLEPLGFPDRRDEQPQQQPPPLQRSPGPPTLPTLSTRRAILGFHRKPPRKRVSSIASLVSSEEIVLENVSLQHLAPTCTCPGSKSSPYEQLLGGSLFFNLLPRHSFFVPLLHVLSVDHLNHQ